MRILKKTIYWSERGKTMIDDRGINEAIARKLQELDRLIEYLEAQLKEAPFGTLRITHNKGNALSQEE